MKLLTNPRPGLTAMRADTLARIFDRVRAHMNETTKERQRTNSMPLRRGSYQPAQPRVSVDYVVDGLVGVRRGTVLKVRLTHTPALHMGKATSYEAARNFVVEGPYGLMVVGPDGTGMAVDHNGVRRPVQLVEPVTASERAGATMDSIDAMRTASTTSEQLTDEQVGIRLRERFDASHIDRLLGLD